MASRACILAVLLALPAAAASSTLYEFHGDLGPNGSDFQTVHVPAGTTVVEAVFTATASVLPTAVVRWDVGIEMLGSGSTCPITFPHPFGWNQCTLTLSWSEPTSQRQSLRLSHIYRGVFHADIVVTAQ